MMEEIENVRVVVRVRPLSLQDIKAGHENVTKIDSVNHAITLRKPTANSLDRSKTFRFDHVFDINSTQKDLYYYIARPIIDKVIQGYNGTILAYGQTGTGKTYTMAGDPKHRDLKGIIPNTFSHILTQISKADGECTFLVRVTYLEIYNEDVRDLLAKKQSVRLEVRERCDIGVYVKNLSGFVVNTTEDMENLMQIGNNNRIVGATSMNGNSSRSHAIFTITVESNDSNGGGKLGKLHLVDLAGSERQSKTQSSGIRLKEAAKINQSLSVLGNVISALVDGKSTHIPYRNSKLTRLLQDSLGGNSKTVMIANISPADADYEETISTLRYASRAKNIQNRARINTELQEGLLKRFQDEIDELRRQLEIARGTPELFTSFESDQTLNTNVTPDDTKVTSIESSIDFTPNINVTPAEIKLPQEEIKKEKKKKHVKKREKPKPAEEEELYDSIEDDELNKTKTQRMLLREKLQNLTNKILVGGENLLEKAQYQEYVLETSSIELENLKRNKQQLENALILKGAERINVEEQYSTLQEEDVGVTKKIKKLQALLNEFKGEHAEKEQEYQREMEALLDNNRLIVRELQLANLMVENYIPAEYLDKIESYMHWNVDTQEWELKCVAYTGNNMRKQLSFFHDQIKTYVPRGTRNVYRQYNSSHRKEHRSTKSRTSSVPRPTRHHHHHHH